MKRIIGTDNQVVRDVMADTIKAYVAANQPVSFTNGDKMYIGADGKIKLDTFDVAKAKVITKRWGKIVLANRQAKIAELQVNPVFTSFVKEYLDGIVANISNLFVDTKDNRNMIAKILKGFINAVEGSDLKGIYLGEDGKLKATREAEGKRDIAWGGMAFDKRVARIQEVIANNIQFVVVTNSLIKEEEDKFLLSGLFEKVVANKNKVAKLLKAYLMLGNKLSFVEIKNDKLVYTGDMAKVTGAGYKSWGSVKWEERVALLSALKDDKTFKDFSNKYLA